MTPEAITDSTISVAAAAGLLLVMARLQGADPLGSRLRAALSGLVVLMILRTMAWITGITLFDTLTTVAAGTIPLLALHVTEGLLRRHAPPQMKWAALAGTLGFAIAAPLPEALAEPWRTGFLLGYQFVMLVALWILVAARNRASLSEAENRAIDRLLLSFLLILPLIASDFRTTVFDTPARLGGVAILGLAWLLLGLGRAASSAREVILGFLALAGLALVTALVLAALADLDLRTAIQTGAILLSILLVFAIAMQVHSLRIEARADTVMRHLAEGSLASTEAFVVELQRRAGVAEAVVLSGSDLADLDPADLRLAFVRHPVQTPALASALPTAQSEAVAFLLDQFEATHLLLLSRTPLTLLALNRPTIGGTDLALLEIKAVQRMAALISAATGK